MFYANDHRKLQWVHLFEVGKSCDGYFINWDILDHAKKAMDILEKYYPNEDHILVFDNATTHLKHTNNALSARKMPKNPSATWGISKIVKDAQGRAIVGGDGKVLIEKIPMADARHPNGQLQPFYFPTGNENAGWFKGMAQILLECGYLNAPKLLAECKDFKCPGGDCSDCCCHHLMYSQPDFVIVKSFLKVTCCACGFNVIFLPKFHCKLNFIEQCWGFAKRLYRMKDWSSSEDVLEHNVISSLDAVPMFINAYDKGLNVTQAAWAIKKY
ncbi:hypothetical protein BS17DRAFT_793306 [Gyrodon lividus]|nr:hypothetical protein BS17DRAFT_793306 [Gyrodon lividus]